VLWITGERYERQQTIIEHARHLPPRITWYADPAGAEEIAALRQFGLVVRKGGNELRAGIAAVRSRLETGKLKVVRSACPNLLAEAQMSRYPTSRGEPGGAPARGEPGCVSTGRTDSETPIDDHNHALAALRYLVTRLDHDFMSRFRRQNAD